MLPAPLIKAKNCWVCKEKYLVIWKEQVYGTIDEPVGHCYDLAGLIHFDRVKAYEHNG
jgi:hypothetical protein